MNKYYIYHLQKHDGPYAVADLRVKARRGEISNESWIAPSGGTYERAAHLRDLHGFLASSTKVQPDDRPKGCAPGHRIEGGRRPVGSISKSMVIAGSVCAAVVIGVAVYALHAARGDASTPVVDHNREVVNVAAMPNTKRDDAEACSGGETENSSGSMNVGSIQQADDALVGGANPSDHTRGEVVVSHGNDKGAAGGKDEAADTDKAAVFRLYGTIVKRIDATMYEIVYDKMGFRDRRTADQRHGILRTRTTEFSTKGKFSMTVVYTGSVPITTKDGFEQEWPVFQQAEPKQ